MTIKSLYLMHELSLPCSFESNVSLALRKNEADGVMVRMLVDGTTCPAAKQFWGWEARHE